MVAQIKIDASAGPLVLRLQAENAQPIKGVISSHDAGDLAEDDVGDPSVAQWTLPAVTALYVVYGVITPLKNLWLGPNYSRTLLIGDAYAQGIANPRRFSTQKHAEGEWVGPPEAFRILVQGS